MIILFLWGIHFLFLFVSAWSLAVQVCGYNEFQLVTGRLTLTGLPLSLGRGNIGTLDACIPRRI